MNNPIQKLIEEKDILEQEVEARFDFLLKEQSEYTKQIQSELNKIKNLINFFTSN